MIYYSYLQGGRYVSKDYSLFGSMEGKQTSKTFDFTGGKTCLLYTSALANYKLFNWGAERVMFVNSISGERGNPHSHTFSNRMVRPGEIVYLDIGNCVNGYMTCYYRTFCCGVPNADQRKA